MTYTQAWDNNRPSGSELAKNIDNEIRRLRQELSERLQDVLISSGIEADPWVLKDAVLGKALLKVLVISPHAFILPENNSKITSSLDAYVVIFTDSLPARGIVYLPPGVTILRFDVAIDKQQAGAVSWYAYKTNINSGVTTIIQEVMVSAAGGVHVSLGGDLEELVTGDSHYGINVEFTGTAGNAGRLYGGRVAYSTPDGRFTI